MLTLTDPQLQGDQLAEELRRELLAAVGQAGAANVVLDFRHVGYLSSPAFRPLLSLRRQLQGAGGRVVLCGLSPDVADVFHVTRLISTSRSSTAPFEVAAAAPAAVQLLNDSAPSP